MNRSVLVFDLDDTLYPEKEYAFSGYRAVAQHFSHILTNPEQCISRMQELYDSDQRNRVFNQICEEAGLKEPETVIPEMIETFRNHKPSIQLHEDARAILKQCSEATDLGLISDGWLNAQRAKFESLGISQFFSSVVFSDQWGREHWKPHPKAFEETMRNLKAEPGQCVYIGDNLAKDFVAPNQLGWKTVFVQRPDGVHWGKPAPPEGKPTITIDDLRDLLSSL